jgi:serine/threonine protein kinase
MIICFDQRTHIGCGAENRNNALRCSQCGRPLRYALLLHDPGKMLRDYRIVRLIGYGGFGAVYEAEDTRNPSRHVAVKETFDHNSIRHFRREFNVLKNHTHDHLPRYYEMFESDDFDESGYLVMEFVPGQSLEDVLKKQGPLLESQVLGYALQICEILGYLHGQDEPIIHRDIKPANIRLTPEGLIKLVDFGLLKMGQQHKRSTVRGATPAYSPYEQFGSGGADHRSDIYSMGATLYQLLTGIEPIPALDRLDVSPDPLRPPHEHNPKISPHVSGAVMKAMSVFQRDRFQEISMLKEALIRPIEQPDITTATPQTTTSSQTRLKSNPITVQVEGWKDEMAPLDTQFGESEGFWCYVPAGSYRIGGWENSQISSTIAIDAFWIARFPVTVRQYAPFVTYGYREDAERWWTPEGWQWKQKNNCFYPAGWDDLDYNDPNQPVIGVSWYEATAFANWLTEQLASILPDGYVIRLATDAEWEVAAAYNEQMERFAYPWGDEDPTPEHAIYDESEFQHTAPVGICPAGAAACGAQDMVGNIWEWVASSYAGYPQLSYERRQDFAANEWDVGLRGGAWDNNKIHIRCGARFWAKPGNRNNYWGFRVVRALPLEETGDGEETDVEGEVESGEQEPTAGEQADFGGEAATGEQEPATGEHTP